MWWKVKKNNEEITGQTRMLTEARAARWQVDTYLSLLWLLAGRMAAGVGGGGGGGGVHWTRAAVGVNVRWEFLLPPSLLQPRVSPMGCNGIKYLPSMQPKARGVLQLAPVDWSGAANKCRKESRCSISLPAATKKKQVNPCYFRREVGEVWEILSVLSSGCPDAGLRNTFPISALSLTRVESRREGAKGAGQRGRESLWVAAK